MTLGRGWSIKANMWASCGHVFNEGETCLLFEYATSGNVCGNVFADKRAKPPFGLVQLVGPYWTTGQVTDLHGECRKHNGDNNALFFAKEQSADKGQRSFHFNAQWTPHLSSKRMSIVSVGSSASPRTCHPLSDLLRHIFVCRRTLTSN